MKIDDPDTLAIAGGRPVRATLLPYARHSITEDDVSAVVASLRSDYITSGPRVEEFERAVAARVGARHAVAFSSGTAALHGCTIAAGLGPGDEAITTPLTFCATSNSVLYAGARPVFADVSPDTGNLDPARAEELITDRTRAILPVDFAGHPADLDAFERIADRHDLVVIEDASHSIGAEYRKRPVGSIADMTVFSFHPAKLMTTGEGGMVTTDDAELAARLARFRGHGIDHDARARERAGGWAYQMIELGYNYRLSEVSSALGLSQLARLDEQLARRRKIARAYDYALSVEPTLVLPSTHADVSSAWHLYIVQIRPERLAADRAQIFHALRAEGIGVNVHYIPVPHHLYYKSLGYARGGWPVAEGMYERMLSLPIFGSMTDQDLQDTVDAVRKVVRHFAR